MRHSDKIDQIAGALCLAQGNMGDIIKTSSNPHFKSKYAALPQVVEAIVPALQAAGIAVMQSGSTTVETMLIHAASGQWIAGDFELPASNDVQKAAGANTYARRYALLGMVCAAAEDDDGNRAAGHEPRKLAEVAKVAPAQPSSALDGNRLVSRAVALKQFPRPDRARFLEWAKINIPECADVDGGFTRRHFVAIEQYLDNIERRRLNNAVVQ